MWCWLKFWMVTLISSPQNRVMPLLFPILSTTNIFLKPSLQRILSIFTFRSLVSIKKTIMGFFYFAKRRSSLTIRKFPSLWQFQLIIFIAVSGVGSQPPPSPIHSFFLLMNSSSCPLSLSLASYHLLVCSSVSPLSVESFQLVCQFPFYLIFYQMPQSFLGFSH
jgi:hypothetical protein